MKVTEPIQIRLDPQEHSDWVWTDEKDVDRLLMGSAMNKVLKDAFIFSKEKMTRGLM